MKITCFADEISPLLSDQIRVLKELDIRYLEFRTVWDTNVARLSDEQLTDIRRALDCAGIRVSCIGSAVGKVSINTPMEEVRAEMARAVRASEILGTDFIRGFTFLPDERGREACMPEAAQRVRGLALQAEAAGKMFLLENSRTLIGNNSRNLLAIVESVGLPSCRIAMDPCNFLPDEEPALECLPRLMPYVAYVHIKDARKEDGVKVLAGQGDAQLEEILKALRGQDLFLSLEPHLDYSGFLRGYTGEEGFCEAAHALKSMLKRLKIL